jgi:PIN domain nuclease of toxin-antitoxin system
LTHVLDTHTLVWFLEASPRLSVRARTAISDPSSQLVIPSIVLVEITFLYSKKRIATSVGEIRRRLLATSNSVVYPLDEQVVALVPTGLEIHDAIVVATALVYRDVLRQDVNIITKDRAIKDSGLVEVLW